MVRKEWKNLNGLWDYAIAPEGRGHARRSCDGKILVPFPVESALSGVMKTVGRDQQLWYRRTFEVPQAQGRQRAAAALRRGGLGGDGLGQRQGSRHSTAAATTRSPSTSPTPSSRTEAQETDRLGVGDPTDAGTQPRGKQVRKPDGIWYTPTTGIWQTVWLEPVPKAHIDGARRSCRTSTKRACTSRPDVDDGRPRHASSSP